MIYVINVNSCAVHLCRQTEHMEILPVMRKIVFAARQLRSLMMVVLMSILFASSAQAKVTKEVLKLDGRSITIPTYAWSDSSIAPKAVLIGLHGGIQHGNHYAALAERLAPQGFLFYSIDFYGHGDWLAKSKKRPKVDYNATAVDLVKLATVLRSQHPGLPVFCIGESLGAAMALKAISSKPKLFDGLILVSAGMRPAAGHHIGATLKSVQSGIMTLGMTVDISDHLKTISDDPRTNDEMINDPLSRTKASLKDLLHTVNFLRQGHSLASKINPDVPVLVLQGGKDQIIQPS